MDEEYDIVRQNRQIIDEMFLILQECIPEYIDNVFAKNKYDIWKSSDWNETLRKKSLKTIEENKRNKYTHKTKSDPYTFLSMLSFIKEDDKKYMFSHVLAGDYNEKFCRFARDLLNTRNDFAHYSVKYSSKKVAAILTKAEEVLKVVDNEECNLRLFDLKDKLNISDQEIINYESKLLDTNSYDCASDSVGSEQILSDIRQCDLFTKKVYEKIDKLVEITQVAKNDELIIRLYKFCDILRDHVLDNGFEIPSRDIYFIERGLKYFLSSESDAIPDDPKVNDDILGADDHFIDDKAIILAFAHELEISGSLESWKNFKKKESK